LALLMLGLTTRNAPPDVAPETIRIASPPDCANALIAGLGLTYVASIAPELKASIASGPALNVLLLKMPLSTPTIADACVTLGK
jgi:hypothetical protein